MRTSTATITTVLAVLSLVSGGVGCRSNGSGPWYQPNSYTWGNPFKTADDSSAPRHGYQQADNAKPSLGAQPNVATPPSGYTSKESEDARFHVNTTQNAFGTDSSRVATAQNTAPNYGGYSSADSSAYHPSYGSGDTAQNTPQNNAPNYQYQQVSAVQPSVYPPAPGYQETSATTYPATPSYTTPSYSNQTYDAGNAAPHAMPHAAAQTPVAPQGNYAPFGAPAQETNPLYGNQPSPAVGYGTQPAPQSATPAPYGTPEHAAGTPNYSYTAAPSNVPPQNNNGFGY